MARHTTIEWTEMTWNPVTGCTKISPGCKFCYAERMSRRLKAMGQQNYANGFKLTLQPQMLDAPLHWKTPRTVFVNSMSDLFHKDVPIEFIQKVFVIMRLANWHTYQVLTKRADRLLSLDGHIDWPANVWMGVSVENEKYTDRIDLLRKTHAKVKFLSVEPLLGPLPNLNLQGIDWVIVGGESGPSARPMDSSWVTDIRDQCLESKVAFFFKQWGGTNKKKTGRALEGKKWNEMPELGTRRLSLAVVNG
jgi:protein gp37